ncbi:unnamed protein product, partial [Adineta ricciae]
ETCVIFGAGPLGLLCLQAAVIVGVSRTAIVDIAEKRLEKVRELGATLVINGKGDDICEQIKHLTDGLLLAVCAQMVPLNTMDIVVREIRFQGILGYPNMFPQTIQLDGIVSEGFEVLWDHPPEAKIPVDMDILID